ncbi:MAG: hypothetical protein Q7S58_16755 [Candidatus Binatus sp.]|uniref:hypothetical protein n=1 Tax=Candidatus Binatus sp. TaxID=2811406 RepID=UPI0027287872|nr:hypothetical protein [Candidatus Binatus sp.]MDO8434049.1 hypothetical protein [Candidatus Binatus sp.]
MIRILPKDVAQIIEQQYPWTFNWRDHVSDRDNSRYRAGIMHGILELIDMIPEELLVFDPKTNGHFILALAHLRANVAIGTHNPNQFQWPQMLLPGQLGDEDCLSIVKNALADCPDQAPSQSTLGMNFIPDAELRSSLLVDLRSAEQALANGEWKVCTVLSGSIIEAVLLAVLKRHSQSELAAAVAKRSTGVPKDLPTDNLTSQQWSLHHYLQVAKQLHEIEGELYDACLLAKNYRNLIHPAVSERKKAVCDRGTSYVNVGAAFRLIDAVERRYGTSSP